MPSNEDLVDPDEQDIDGALAALSADEEGEDTAPPAPTPGAESYDDVFADEDAQAQPADTGQPRGPDGKFIEKADADATTTEAPATAGASESPETPPPDPFAAWAPFTFKADGIEAAIDGIRANETHIVIPRQVWDEQFRPNHVANREAWQEERGQWQERVQQAETYARQVEAARSEREQRAEAVIQQFNELIADPAKLEQFLTDFERQAPILQARIEADTYRAQLEQRQHAERAYQQQAEYERLFDVSTDTYEADVRGLLKDPKYAALATNEDEITDLLAELWNPALMLIPDRDVPELGYRRGVPVTQRDAIIDQLDRRAAFLARRQTHWQQTTQAEARNAAAVASPVTSPRTVPNNATRSAAARQTPTAPHARRATTPAPASTARRITDEDREKWKQDFASAFDD